MNLSNEIIYIFAPNLVDRKDRKEFLISQFIKLNNFELKIFPPVYENDSRLSLWKTIQFIIKEKVNWENNFFVFCEDDHQFTEHFNFELLKKCILEADGLEADILLGGVSWFKTAVQVSKNLFWVEKFSGLQFTIIFKKFYQKILDVKNFAEGDAADYKIASLTDRKFVTHPFISKQKDFGYSDVTEKNNEAGRVEKLFHETSERFELLKKVRGFYLPDFK